VKITVTIVESLQSSSTTATVFVRQGAVQAMVSGATEHNVRLGHSITIDGGASYDEDVGEGLAAGLTFEWTCSQTAPTFDSVCPLVMVPSDSDLTLKATQASSVDSSSLITLLVSDGGSRQSQATVKVNVLPELSAVVTVTVDKALLNPSQNLELTGSVILPEGMSGEAVWSMDETSLSLEDGAKGALTVDLQTISSTLFLPVKGNFLSPGSSATFTLSCTIPRSDKTHSSSITVDVNAPPMLGGFEVTPSTGTALQDYFTFSASRWQDVHLPLSYQFGYADRTGKYVVMQARSEGSYSSFLLPAGEEDEQGETGEASRRRLKGGVGWSA
jgi:hypothetical protein